MKIFEQLSDGLGLWSEILTKSKSLEYRPALFLDRDGTIVNEENYLHEPSKIKINNNISSIISSCNSNNIPVIEITNQSGVGRGLYNWDDFNKTEKEIRKKLLINNAQINMLCACAFHHEAQNKYKVNNHFWRKPNPGMIEEARNAFNINLNKSWIIGDKVSDIEAGINAGIKGGILYNNLDKSIIHNKNFLLKYAHKNDNLEWLIKEFK